MEQSDKWIEFASKNGWALLALIGIGVLFYKKIWPLVEKTWERGWALIEKRLADADARDKDHQRLWKEQGELFAAELARDREANERRFDEQGKLFTESMRRQTVLMAETHKESMKAQTKIAEKLDILDQHMRNGNGK
jgi:hypothetical protein